MSLRSARLALLAALFAVPAAATVIIAQSLEQLAKSSPLVVRARVGQIQAAWNEENTTIETWVEVVVSETLKGKAGPGSSLMIRNPGGIVGDRGARVHGAPTFRQGEDTLLFLEPALDKPGIWLVSAMAAGKVSFAKNGLGEVRAMRDLRGLAFYQQTSDAPKFFTVDKPEDLGTPDAFLTRIRLALGAPR